MSPKVSNLFKLAMPTHSLFGSTDVTEGLPVLNKNPRANMILWNTIVSSLGVGGLVAAIKALSAESHDERWRRKQDEALATKVNSIMPIARPDTTVTDDDKDTRKQLKELAMHDMLADSDMSKKAADNVGDFVTELLAPTIPLIGAGTAAVIANNAVDSHYINKSEEALDKQIAQYQAELESLQARILAKRVKSNSSVKKLDTDTTDIYKTANSTLDGVNRVRRLFGLLDDDIKSPGDMSLWDIIVKYPFVSSLAIGVPITAGAYMFFNKNDKDRKTVNTMEDVAATNLSNVPPRLMLALDENGNPMVKGSTEIA